MSSTEARPFDALASLQALAVQAAPASTVDASYFTSEEFAAALDASDALASFRAEFHIPRRDLTSDAASAGDRCVYLCGNSLGLQPKRTEPYLLEELAKWRNMGVEGHFRGARPWASVDELVTGHSATLVGAKDASEVAVMNSLSANLHLMLTSFYRPTAARHKIFIEHGAFCSDYHAVKSQLSLHGYDPASALLSLPPRAGETFLRTEDIVAFINERGSEIATVLFPGVQFYTGQSFDIAAITAAARAQGCTVGFDLAHAVGNMPLRLHDWGVDFAVWCNYKYLNSGPGTIAGAFVHARHAGASLTELPRLCGWWGQELRDRFGMSPEWQPKHGAQSWQLSNPAVVAVVCLQAALEVHTEATLPALRAKSERLTGYLEALLATECGVWSSENGTDTAAAAAFDLTAVISPGYDAGATAASTAGPEGLKVRQLTPRDPAQRGCQLSLLFSGAVKPVAELLVEQGIVCDERKPNVLRVSPTPLYNSFSDVWRFVRALKKIIKA
jgi:kynureninase